jgi:hypothetical protein
MIDLKKLEKKLYEDAMVFHLLNSGYSVYKANYLIKRLLTEREKLF